MATARPRAGACPSSRGPLVAGAARDATHGAPRVATVPARRAGDAPVVVDAAGGADAEAFLRALVTALQAADAPPTVRGTVTVREFPSTDRLEIEVSLDGRLRGLLAYGNARGERARAVADTLRLLAGDEGAPSAPPSRAPTP